MPLKSGGLKFNGTSDYVDCGAIPYPVGAKSFELWVKQNPEYSINPRFITVYKDSNNSFQIFGRGKDFSNFGAKIVENGVVYDSVADIKPQIQFSQWNHVVVVFNNGLTFYLNGSLVPNGNPTSGGNPSNTTLWLGKFLSSFTNMILGATRIYNRALPPTEVYNNYQGSVSRNGLVGEWLLNATSGTVATDTSGNGNHGVLNGGQWVNKAVKMKPKKNLFDGTYQLNTAISTDGTVVNNTNAISTGYMQVQPNTTYALFKNFTWQDRNVVGFYDSSKNKLSANISISSQLTTPTNCYYIAYYFWNGSGGNRNSDLANVKIQIEQGSTATPFEPYTLVPDLVSVKTPLRPSTTKRALKFDQRDYSFSRQSNEPYNGLIVPMDTPRVDGNGVIVEEGTTNLVPSLDKFRVSNGASSSMVVQNMGSGIYRFSNSGTGEGFFVNDNNRFTLSPSTTYTLTFKARGNIGVNTFDYFIISTTGTLAQTAEAKKPLTDSWQTLTKTFTTTADITGQNQYVRFDHNGSDVGYIEVKEVQLEQKSYPTSFTETTRQAETLTFPTANVLNASEGTIEVWAYDDGVNNRQAFIFDTSNSASLRFLMWKNPTTYEIFTNSAQRFNSPLKPVGWHLYTIRWSGTMLDLLIDGVKQNQSAITIPEMGFDDKMYIGSRYTKIYQWNNPIKSLRISNKARTDQEILDSFNQSQAYMHLKFDDNTTKLLNF